MNRIALFLLAFFVSAAAPAEPPGVPLDGIAAVVNDDILLRSELENRVRRVRRQLETGGGPQPPAEVLERQVLERLILERLQLQRAEQMGIQIPDDVLNQAMNDIARSNGMTLSEFIEAVTADGFEYAAVREEVRNEMIISQLHQRDVLARIAVTQREVESFLASQAGQDFDDREFRVSHIALRVPGGGSEDVERTRALGEALLGRLRDGADFAQLALEYSQGQQALEGGDLGWRKTTQLPSVFAERVVGMQPGQVSDLIRTSGAFHIIKLNEVRGHGERVVVSQTHARHILVRTNALVNDERAAARLHELRGLLLEGADFAELARRHSEDPGSAVNGGDLGWIEPGQTVPEFEEVMDSLQPGEIGEPFASRFGWHIVQVLERREHDSTDELRLSQARRAIRERKAEEQTEQWLKRLRDEAWIENRLEG